MNTEPARDPRVPTSAVWDPKRKEFCLCAEVDGKREGEGRWFRADGTLCCVCSYVAGKSHGSYERFHTNGEVSQAGRMHEGERDGHCIWQRSSAETQESTLPDSVPENVWRAEIEHASGLPYPTLFYDRDDQAVLADGKPMPERPQAVEKRAAYSPSEEVWFFGLGAQAHAQREGTWRWWTPQGRKASERDFAKGVELRVRFYDDDGTLKTEVINDAAGERCYQRSVDPQGRETTSAGDAVPQRPPGVDTNAKYDTQDERWVFGKGLDGDTPRDGKWTWWTPQGVVAEQRDYRDGKRVAQRKYHDNGKLFIERWHDSDGNPTREAYFYDDGDLNHSIDRTFEQGALTTVEVRKYECGLTAKGRKAETGMFYEFFDPSAKLTARGHVEGTQASGNWEFFGAGDPQVVDVTERELYAKVDEDFEPSWILGRALLEREGAEPFAALLSGVKDIDWEEVSSCYGDTEDFPAYLQAMLSDVPAVREIALSEIEGETLHQGTVYVATAKVVPFLIRLLEHDNANTHAVLSHVHQVASHAGPWATQALEWGEGSEDREAILGTVHAVAQGFERIARLAQDDSSQIRGLVLALAAYGGDAGKALLIETVGGEDDTLRAVAVDGLLGLDSATPQDAIPLLEHQNALTRCVAAIATARRFGPDAPPTAVAVLRESLTNADALAKDYAELPFVESGLLTDLALGLGNTRTPAAMELAPALAAKLPKIPFGDSADFCQGAFALCFGRGERPFARGFVAVLEAVAHYKSFDGFVNFYEVAERWGLPRERREYRALAETLRGHSNPEEHMHAIMHAQ